MTWIMLPSFCFKSREHFKLWVNSLGFEQWSQKHCLGIYGECIQTHGAGAWWLAQLHLLHMCKSFPTMSAGTSVQLAHRIDACASHPLKLVPVSYAWQELCFVWMLWKKVHCICLGKEVGLTSTFPLSSTMNIWINFPKSLSRTFIFHVTAKKNHNALMTYVYHIAHKPTWRIVLLSYEF